MKTSLRQTVAALALMFLTLPVKAEDFTYVTNNGTITITGYIGPGGEVVIPDSLNGLPVTTIEDEAFYSCTNLTSIAIASSVARVGDWVFYSCTNLANAIIPDSVTNIGIAAFEGCTRLTSIRLPNNITSLGEQTFVASKCRSSPFTLARGNETHIRGAQTRKQPRIREIGKRRLIGAGRGSAPPGG